MTNADLIDAMHRLLNDRGQKGDGAAMQLWLRRRLLSITAPGADVCAVRDHEGQRRLAAILLGIAARPDDDPHEAEKRDTRHDTDFERDRQRGSGPARRGIARRIS